MLDRFRRPAIAWIAICAMALPLPLLAQAPVSGHAAARRGFKVFFMPVVLGPGVSKTTTGRMTSYVDTLISIDDRFVVAPAGAVAGAAAPAKAEAPEIPEDRRLKKADELFWKAREARGKGQLRRATGMFKQVVRVYAQRFAYMEDFTQMVEALYEAARTFHAVGSPGMAASMLKVLFTLRRDTAIDPHKASPEFVALAEKARARAGNRPGGLLKITTRPAGANVFVDGILAGKSPAEVHVDVAGPHFVVARLSGYRPAGRRVGVPSKRTIRARLNMSVLRKAKRIHKAKPIFLKDVQPLVEAGNFNSSLMRMLGALASRAGVDFIVIAHIGSTGGQLVYAPFVFVAGGGQGSAGNSSRVLIPAEPIALADDLSTLQVSLLPVPDRLASVMAHPPEDRAVHGVPQAWKVAPVAAPVVAPVAVHPAAPTPRPASAPKAPRSPVVSKPVPPPVIAQPAPPPVVARDAPPPSPTYVSEEGGKKSVFKKWWFWTLIAVGVGGAVTAAVVLSDSGSSSDTFSADIRVR